jgi:hypothetical protein
LLFKKAGSVFPDKTCLEIPPTGCGVYWLNVLQACKKSFNRFSKNKKPQHIFVPPVKLLKKLGVPETQIAAAAKFTMTIFSKLNTLSFLIICDYQLPIKNFQMKLYRLYDLCPLNHLRLISQ